MNEPENPIPRTVDAVAEAENAESLALAPPLAEAVDPDALRTLVEETTVADLEVRFTYRGHDVVVDEGGGVRVD